MFHPYDFSSIVGLRTFTWLGPCLLRARSPSIGHDDGPHPGSYCSPFYMNSYTAPLPSPPVCSECEYFLIHHQLEAIPTFAPFPSSPIGPPLSYTVIGSPKRSSFPNYNIKLSFRKVLLTISFLLLPSTSLAYLQLSYALHILDPGP